ncbi:MAG: Maf family nucleotide pyrophosphatase [Pseudomonadota bacterium]
MADKPTLILASTSPYRRELLLRLGLVFHTVAPGVDEAPREGEAPAARAARLARAKAEAVASDEPAAVVIGSDQVASCSTATGLTILDKPLTAERSRAQLAAMSGREVHFDTAVTVLWPGGGADHVDLTRVVLRDLSATAIDRYLARESALDCAGGFKAEGLGITLMKRIESQDPTGLIGLPLIWLGEALRRAGLDLP